ncbi:helix-turn-helix domain-containing protein [uncultured Roseovarius sp.]|uniref:helix-turn-helix domain-containing protein n=1 Tax=uncultured Roseovarius sp. TaxID=293344 RepID=UPI00260195E8|nr:helix-turn-helix domain-containing protein [uncultured Roseovarius sp.]
MNLINKDRKAKSAEDTAVAAKLRARGEASELQIGSRLQMLREEKGLSQRELAKKAGVTAATISLIEQESHAPSLASLHKILCAMSIEMAEFFALPTTRKSLFVYARDELFEVSSGAAELFEMCSERRDKSLQMFLEHYDVGGGTGVEPLSHDGETAVIVITGEITLKTEGETHVIRTGGGFHLFGKSPYKIRNSGTERASIVCAVTPPYLL